jgi:transposase
MDATIVTERVDDIPILLSTINNMGIPEIVDQIISPHKNWAGLSPGYTIAIWLTHILYTGEHTLSHVQSWAEKRLNTLSAVTGKNIRARDFSDDRLGLILEKLADKSTWENIENQLNERLIRVYDLETSVVRVDCTTVNSYALVTDDGLIQFGISKGRSDLPQIKIPLATLDPYGLPLCISTVKGNCADDPQYLPTIRRVRSNLQKSGLIYVGDCKMGAIAIRADIMKWRDYYLCPLSEVSFPISELDMKIQDSLNNAGDMKPVVREYSDGEEREVALAFEETVEITFKTETEDITWNERRIYAKSLSHAKKMKESLDQRIENSVDKINHLNKRGRGNKPPKTVEEAVERVNKIIEKSNLKNIVTCSYQVEETDPSDRVSTGKSSRGRRNLVISVMPEVNKQAYEQKSRTLGWCVFVTNQSSDKLPIEKVVLLYRNQFTIEVIFRRIKGKAISIQPMYLHRDDRIDGLVKLVSLAVRVLICIEKKVWDSLEKTPESVTGIYPYQPKRDVQKPRAERILEAFEGTTLTIVVIGHEIVRHITELSDLQRQLLRLLGLNQTLYQDVCTKSSYFDRI